MQRSEASNARLVAFIDHFRTILRDSPVVIVKAGSQIAFVVDAVSYLLDQLNAGCSAPLSYSSRARFNQLLVVFLARLKFVANSA